jgi:E3 SUMO-protein ligase PIAS1
MATSSRALQDQANTLSSRIKTLINADLKEICRGENLAVSGVKAGLQARIIQRRPYPSPSSLSLSPGHEANFLLSSAGLEELAQTGDVVGITRLRYRVLNHGAAPPDTSTPTYPSSSSPMQHQANGYGRLPQGIPRGPSYQSMNGSNDMGLDVNTAPARVLFRESPFYEVKDTLAQPISLEGTFLRSHNFQTCANFK